MARCCCNSRIFCLCLLPCMMMGHLFIYILVAVIVTISNNSANTPPPLPLHFVASGASKNSTTLASHPLAPFWNLRLQEGALWNHLQHQMDRQHNPILRPASVTKTLAQHTPGNGTVLAGANGTTIPTAGLNQAFEIAPPLTLPAVPCEQRPQLASLMPDFNGLPQQIRDFVVSMNCRNYALLVDQPELCRSHRKMKSHKAFAGGNSQQSAEAPMLLMAIKSQVGNFESRQAIRETWGRSGWTLLPGGADGGGGRKGGGGGGGRGTRALVQTVFLLGRQDSSTGPHPNLDALLELESHRHGDILQWDFRDTFFNLTLKDVLFWEWFGQRCPGARFVFKGDDDVFVRTDLLLDYLVGQMPHTTPTHHRDKNNSNSKPILAWDFLVGDVISHAWPNRQPETKYFIPESFYAGVYPAYAGGGGVVYSGWLALRFRNVSRRVHLFPIDDVYLGMCLRRLGLSPMHHPGFLTFDLPETEREKPCAYRNVILVHKRTPRQMLMLWKQLKETVPSSC